MTAAIAASVVLLIASGLLVRALWRVRQIDPAFRADNVLTLRTALPATKYAATARRQAFYDRVLGVRTSSPHPAPPGESVSSAQSADIYFDGGFTCSFGMTSL